MAIGGPSSPMTMSLVKCRSRALRFTSMQRDCPPIETRPNNLGQNRPLLAGGSCLESNGKLLRFG
jgi:hypothetical protein